MNSMVYSISVPTMSGPLHRQDLSIILVANIAAVPLVSVFECFWIRIIDIALWFFILHLPFHELLVSYLYYITVHAVSVTFYEFYLSISLSR